MAIQFMDGFDTYSQGDNSDLLYLYSSVSGIATVSTVRQRTGAASLRYTTGATNSRGVLLQRQLSSPQTTVGVGLAFNLVALPTANFSCHRIISLVDVNGLNAVALQFTSLGEIEIYNNATSTAVGTLVASSTGANLVIDTWYHLEFKVILNGGSSTVQVRLNGVEVVNATVTLSATSLSYFQPMLKSSNSTLGNEMFIDDLVVWDGTGGVNNNWLGDCAVQTLAPVSNGTPQDFTAVGAASGYEAIDEQAEDGDATYITASATGESRFGLADLTGTGVVKGVAAVVVHRKTDTGDSDIRVGVSTTAGLVESSDIPQMESYSANSQVFDTQAGATAWSVSAVNEMELVVKRTL